MPKDKKGMSPEGKKAIEEYSKIDPGCKHEQAVRFCEEMAEQGMPNRISSMFTFLTTEVEKLEAATKENRKLIDAMLEARQIAAKVQVQNETNRTEYMVELNKRVDVQEKQLAKLELRAH